MQQQNAGARVQRIALEVDQNVDPVRMDGARGLDIGEGPDVAEGVEGLFEPLAHGPAIVRAIGIGAHVEAGAVMRLQRLDEQQGGGVVLKIAGEIAEADFCPRAAIEAEIEPGAFRAGSGEPVADPQFGAGALLGRGDAGLRKQMEGRELADSPRAMMPRRCGAPSPKPSHSHMPRWRPIDFMAKLRAARRPLRGREAIMTGKRAAVAGEIGKEN